MKAMSYAVKKPKKPRGGGKTPAKPPKSPTSPHIADILKKLL